MFLITNLPPCSPNSLDGNIAVYNSLPSGLSACGNGGPFVAPNFSANSCVHKVATGLFVLSVKPVSPLYSNSVKPLNIESIVVSLF